MLKTSERSSGTGRWRRTQGEPFIWRFGCAIPVYLILWVNLAAGWKETRAQLTDQVFNLIFSIVLFLSLLNTTSGELMNSSPRLYHAPPASSTKKTGSSNTYKSFWWPSACLTHPTAEQQPAARSLLSTPQRAAQQMLRLIFKWKPP